MKGVGHRQLTEPECVDIQCVDFQLRSSPAVEQLRLNNRVRFAVNTRFSCEGASGRGSLLFRTWQPLCCALLRLVQGYDMFCMHACRGHPQHHPLAG